MTPRIAAASPHSLIAASFIVCAIVLGGGGSPNPATEVLLQLLFVALAMAWLWLPLRGGPPPRPRASFWLIGALIIALPLLQLVPLPPAVWTGVSGNEDRAAALALVGREQTWQPLTHSAPRTLAAVLAIIPALFAFFATASLDARGRLCVVGAIAVTALAASLLGALQVSLGPSAAPYLYAQSSPTLTGFQANRNAAADVLLIGMTASAALLVPSLARTRGGGGALLANRGAAAVVLAGVMAVFFFAILLTASRMGIALLPLALAGVWLILLPALPERRLWTLGPAVAALAAVPIVAIVAWRMGNTALAKVAERFVFADDARRELWRDGWFVMNETWPLGVGFGGAQPAMVAAERLEVLDPALPNRVHNDYLELALEGGLPALVVLAGIAALLLAAAWRSWFQRPDDRHLIVLGVVILLVVALHSFVDYPLRSMALACLAGTGAGLLISTPRRPEANEPSR